LFEYDEPVRELSRGAHTVNDARAIYAIRQRTAKKAGADVWGIEDLLDALEGLPTSCSLLVFHYGTDERLFSAFVGEDDGSFVACVSAPRRARGDE
jgi:hypothetical protein